MSNQIVNLEEVGLLSRSGRGYQATAEDNVGTARQHLSRMEGAQAGFKGAAGSAFQDVAQVSVGNHTLLARQIAEQARRAVTAERHAVAGDEQASARQSVTRSSTEALASAFARPVNV
ncbi:hypothetical protein KV102_01025 [Mumia sp. zg.B53]|uniref:hypothetical protein n=1 Tax=unclassified Mumia TaxID=2621872 RepID=UPI001C6EB3A9|nr:MULTISPECIES: hypothetical protein [unclassified Mumia]MBW9213410.1 hypothetical protein [Mumia sp. zg.B53]MDD9349476.1 hypothetical protein [Mumia sp.]